MYFSGLNQSIPTSFVASTHTIVESGRPLVVGVWRAALSDRVATFPTGPTIMIKFVIAIRIEGGRMILLRLIPRIGVVVVPPGLVLVSETTSIGVVVCASSPIVVVRVS